MEIQLRCEDIYKGLCALQYILFLFTIAIRIMTNFQFQFGMHSFGIFYPSIYLRKVMLKLHNNQLCSLSLKAKRTNIQTKSLSHFGVITNYEQSDRLLISNHHHP